MIEVGEEDVKGKEVECTPVTKHGLGTTHTSVEIVNESEETEGLR